MGGYRTRQKLFFRVFLKIAEVIIPPDDVDEGAVGPDFENRAVEFFENMPWRARMVFTISLWLIEIISIFRFFKPFSSLPVRKREIFVERWTKSKMMVKRIIISAMKGLISMIYLSLENRMPELKKYDEMCAGEERWSMLKKASPC